MEAFTKLLHGVFIFGLAAISGCSPGRAIDRHTVTIQSLENSTGTPDTQEIIEVFEKNLKSYTTKKILGRLSNDSLRELFSAAFSAAYYSGSRSNAQALENAAFELRGRGLFQKTHAMDLQGIQILTRDFEGARRLSQQFPQFELEKIPHINNFELGGAATSMEVEGDVLQVKRLAPAADAQIIAIASLSCGPSNRALQDISSDPELSAIFKDHAAWVVPPRTYLDFEKIKKWNRENPSFKFRHAFSTEGWNGIEKWDETPVFFFFKDGRISASVIGWPRGGRRDEFRKALEKIGLNY